MVIISPIVLLAVLGFLSIGMTTKAQRAEARRRFARWNPLFISVLIIEAALFLWPWPKP